MWRNLSSREYWRKLTSREHWRKVVGPYLGSNPREKAIKYTAILRVTYFFAVTTTCLYVYKKRKEIEAQLELESGRPLHIEADPKYRRSKQRATQAGLIYKYNENGVLEKVEFDQEKYYETLEQEILEEVKEAQRKAMKEGRELPPDAIRLV